MSDLQQLPNSHKKMQYVILFLVVVIIPFFFWQHYQQQHRRCFITHSVCLMQNTYRYMYVRVCGYIFNVHISCGCAIFVYYSIARFFVVVVVAVSLPALFMVTVIFCVFFFLSYCSDIIIYVTWNIFQWPLRCCCCECIHEIPVTKMKRWK